MKDSKIVISDSLRRVHEQAVREWMDEKGITERSAKDPAYSSLKAGAWTRIDQRSTPVPRMHSDGRNPGNYSHGEEKHDPRNL